MDREKKKLIDQVTSNDEKPAPGWILDQMARKLRCLSVTRP